MNRYAPNKHPRFYSIILLLSAVVIAGSGLFYSGASVALSDDAAQTTADSEARAAAVVRIKASVEYLCSEELAGRGLQKDGLAKAGKFIEEEFESLGLSTEITEPAADQSFRMKTVTSMAAGNSLTISAPKLSELKLRPPKLSEKSEENLFPSRGSSKSHKKLADNVDFMPLSRTATGEFDLPLSFGGYGLIIAKHDYNDYEDIDVEGKLVVILRGIPKYLATDRRTQYASTLETKISLARVSGARGVLFCDPSPSSAAFFTPNGSSGKTTPLPALPHDDVADNFFVGFVKRDMIKKVLQSTGRDLDAIEKRIHKNHQPESGSLPGCRAKGNFTVDRESLFERNIVAVLKGSGPHADETVVIGGHYDHIGLRPNSNDPNKFVMYPGADDNASGIAIILEAARILTERKEPLDRTIVFVAFTGEERGLLGSKHYCEHPIRSLDKTVAMVNLDMVGKLHQRELTLSGTGTGDRWNEFFAVANSTGELNLVNRTGQVGMSDHAPFVRKEIPAIHAFTGFHLDYHKPTDTTEKLNYEGMAITSEFMASLLTELANAKTPMKFQAKTSSGGKKVAFFGIAPGYSAQSRRVHISQVFKESPAKKAGLQRGDVIKQIDRRDINNLQTLFGIIQKKKPGDKIVVDIERDDKPLKIEVKLGEAVRR